MENESFNTENILTISLDLQKLSGTLNLLYQFHRSNSSNINSLHSSLNELSSTSQTISNSLSQMKTTFESFELFKAASMTKQKNLESQVKNLEETLSVSIKSLEKRFPDLSTQFFSEVDKLKSEQKNAYTEIRSKLERKLKKSKTSILQSVELSRVEGEGHHDPHFHRQNSENLESLNARVEQIETSLKRMSFEDLFENSDDSSNFQKLKTRNFEERNDLLVELNSKYMTVVNEVAKLREMIRFVSSLPEEEPVVVPSSYNPYSTRISRLEVQFQQLQDSLKAEKSSYVPEKDAKVKTPNPLSKKRKSLTELTAQKPVKFTASQSQDLAKVMTEVKALIYDKVSYSEVENLIKNHIEYFLSSNRVTVSELESRIFKEIDHRSEVSSSGNLKSPVVDMNERSCESRSVNDDQFLIKELLKTVNDSLDKQLILTTGEIERLSAEIKAFEAKINKLMTSAQVQDLRSQDLLKRVQTFEDFKLETTDQIQKIQDRFRKTSLKSSEELEKTVSQLQELEKIRSNVQEIIQKMQEGSKLHKRDYETIQELKMMLESKLSKEELDHKVDKNDLKKMFRNLSKRVKNTQIERIQSDIKSIEETGMNDSMKKLEEPLITTRKLSSECLACGRDLSVQNRSQLPGFSKILPVLSNTFENNRRLKTERFSISVQDSEFLPILSRGQKN